MKFITTHVYILSGVVNSSLLPLSEKGILSLRSNGLGEWGVTLLLRVPSHQRELHFFPLLHSEGVIRDDMVVEWELITQQKCSLLY